MSKDFNEAEDKKELVICNYCGIVIHLPTAKDYQYEPNYRKQKVHCPVCKGNLPEE